MSSQDAPGDAALIARLDEFIEELDADGACKCCDDNSYHAGQRQRARLLQQAVEALTGLQARVRELEQQIKDNDDLARSPSLDSASTTGSPRSPQPEGSER